MPAPFKQITREQFAELINAFDFKRKINGVHMHHTFRPNHSQYDKNDGHKAILGMYLHHTKVNKWQDIAQHITIAPDGTIWLGRNWNLPPASAAGHNGNKDVGPFMFEIIGDFNRGHDRLEGEQRKTVIDVIARVQRRWGLAPETLRFHNSMSTKSCPGTSFTYDAVVGEVRERHSQLAQEAAEARAPKRAPFDAEHHEVNEVIQAALDALGRDVPAATDPADAEPDYEDAEQGYELAAAEHDMARGLKLTPHMLAALRPHLVNLNFGQFSAEGEWKTDQGDVDVLFGQHLERALRAAEQDNAPLRIVFFAHGGLIKESAGLEIAHKHVKWWIDNRIYPIYFVWESGLYETIGQLLLHSQQGARSFISEHISDPILEQATRALKGPTIWGGMKLSAERAVAEPDTVSGEGGARYVAKKLKEFCDRNKTKNIELHAVGHSAGAIFHSHFLSVAHALAVPSFKSVHFLAPAVRVDTFKTRLAGLMGQGKGIDQLSLFTMSKDYERNDSCAQIYRKSLLYLIHHALEPEPETPILGLDQCLRADAELQSLFGLNAAGTAPGEVIFSVSPIDKGKSASTSTTHGGFDDDAPTMNSVAKRILGKADADAIVEYSSMRDGARAFDLWQNQVDWPAPLDRAGNGRDAGSGIGLGTGYGAAQIAPALLHDGPAVIYRGPMVGHRLALCIGINQYLSSPLNGCVADAEEWAKTFIRLGFDTMLMRDAEATRDAIIKRLNDLIGTATAGDIIAFQFAGHGTYLPDLDGDEDEDDTDEAIVPYDFETSGFLIDDDIRGMFAMIPDGVNLTCFFDCCHSGSNTRFAVGAPPAVVVGDQRKRFMPPTDAMFKAHKEFRSTVGKSRAIPPGGPEQMKNVAFSACRHDEVAWENNGHGDFTLRATRLLQAGIDGMTHQQFNQRLIAEFGANARQHPILDCASGSYSRTLLQPLIAASAAATAVPNGANGIRHDLPPDTRADMIQTLQTVIQQLHAS